MGAGSSLASTQWKQQAVSDGCPFILPTTKSLPSRHTLYVLLPVLRSGKMRTLARPATSLSPLIFCLAMTGSTAASYWIGPASKVVAQVLNELHQHTAVLCKACNTAFTSRSAGQWARCSAWARLAAQQATALQCCAGHSVNKERCTFGMMQRQPGSSSPSSRRSGRSLRAASTAALTRSTCTHCHALTSQLQLSTSKTQ